MVFVNRTAWWCITATTTILAAIRAFWPLLPGLPHRLGVLIAVGASIWRVLAMVATGPAREAEEREITCAVAVITVFGILATRVYP